MRTARAITCLVTLFALLGALVLTSAPAGAVILGANGRVVFASNRSGSMQVYSMRGDGSAVTQLTSIGNNSEPAVSGDGQKVAFISDRDGTPELYTMTIDGKAQKRLTINSMIESHPSWSPTSASIVFAALVGSDSDLWTITAAGGSLTDITPDPAAFDANPAWGPGGHLIAFDSTNRGGDSGTEIYTILDFGTISRLTTTGTDSHPSWGPTQSNIVLFESGRDNAPTGPAFFASMKNPDGVAVAANAVLVTQTSTDKVSAIAPTGAVSTFATLPPTGASVEKYIAVSPGLGGFPAGYVYVTVNQNVYQITPDGLTVSLFTNIPQLVNGNVGITFDTVGTFGFNMIVTDRRGPVWTVDSTGAATQIADALTQIEGPAVAPMSFAPFGGWLLVSSKLPNTVFAIQPGCPVICKDKSVVGNWFGAEATLPVPTSVCDLGTSQGAYFVALKDPQPGSNQGRIIKFPAGDFAGITDGLHALVGSELDTSIGLFTSNGTSIDVSTFHGPIGTPELEGSAFTPCGSGGGGAGSGAVAPTHEIYKMLETGASQTRLTNNTTDDVSPASSPDGSLVVFATDRDDPNQATCEATHSCQYELYTMNATDGTNQTNITNNVPFNDTSPDWQSVTSLVSVVDFAFVPSTVKGSLGGTVMFDFFGPSDHTVTDNSGMGLFDSGTKSPGSFFLYTFRAAGQFPIVCTIHPTQMTGLVKVPMNANPPSGTTTTVFTISWATTNAQSPYVYDVQILRPGSGSFVPWKTGVMQKSGTFTPDAGTGQYLFQARIRNTDPLHMFSSGYSAPRAITVT